MTSRIIAWQYPEGMSIEFWPPRHREQNGGLRSLVMNTSDESRGVLYVVVCAAPAASDVDDLVSRAQADDWVVRVIATPMAERFIDAPWLAAMTGDRVRTEFRMPDEPDELPKADAVVVAPATFNTINKWAAGITDTFATGLLCELTGVGVPILAVPLVKAELARHVAFEHSLEVLSAMGVRMLFDPAAPPQSRMPTWPKVLEELDAVTEHRPAGGD
jgi:phosphopantothenoylcysteine synthetase/decarboxylase